MTIYAFVRFALMICLGINSGIFGAEQLLTKLRSDSAPVKALDKSPIPPRAASDSVIHSGESQKCKELRSITAIILGAGDIELLDASGDEEENDGDIQDDKGLLPESYLKQRDQAHAIPIAMGSKKQTDTTQFVAPKPVRVKDYESIERMARIEAGLEEYRKRKSSRKEDSPRGFVAAEEAMRVHDEELQFDIEL